MSYAASTLPELKALAEKRGIKKPGVGWPKCCPPDGNKAAVIAALEKADAAAASTSTDFSNIREQLASRTKADLQELAERQGIKKPGVGWPTCCPPNGDKDDIVNALVAQQQDSPPPKSPAPEAVKQRAVPTTPTTDPGTRVQVGTGRTSAESVRRALGRFDDGKLIPTAEFASQKADVTAQLLSQGLKMPQHVPLCTPSFAVRDLAAKKDEEGRLIDEDGIDDKAGRDPWAIMDYVRDFLHWPQDAVFIDKEAFGYYAHPGENWDPKGAGVPAGEHLPAGKWSKDVAETYVEDGSIRPWCAKSPEGGWPVQYRIMSGKDKTKEADSSDQRVRATGLRHLMPDALCAPAAHLRRPHALTPSRAHAICYCRRVISVVLQAWVQRNYRGVYKWAQRVSPCLIFFMSKGWLQSDNCTVELSDLGADLAEASAALSERLVVLVQLDNDDKLSAECAKQIKQLKSTSRSGVQIEYIDLSGYMAWLDGEGKTQLKEASRGIQELCAILEGRFGRGSIEIYEKEKAERRAEHDAPHVLLNDLKGKPVRNRYLARYQRRINLNGVSVDTLKEKLPGVGEVKAQRIHEFIQARRGIESLSELEAVEGVAKKTLADIEPFVTTEGAFQSPPYPHPISWPHDPKLTQTCFRTSHRGRPEAHNHKSDRD
jgi:hypothetical protein